MPNFDTISFDVSSLPQAINLNELMIITSSPYNLEGGTWTSNAKAKLQILSSVRFHALSLSFAFDPKSESKYLLAEWHNNELGSFEARWLLFKSVTKFLATTSFKSLAVCTPHTICELTRTFAEDLYLAGFSHRYEDHRFSSFRFLSAGPLRDQKSHKERLHHLAEYRRWTNENPDQMSSFHIGDMLKQFSVDYNLPFEKMRTSRLEEEKLYLLAAVGRASEASPSRMYTLTYNPKPGVKPIVLIGKGITFDTGGINLKSSEPYLNAMKNDMAGAALMSNLFMALVKSGYPHPLNLVIPACENAISHNSIKPGSILNSRSGKSVIIQNTDAEGRLILSDAIHWSQEKYDPAKIITAATLTAASLTQFSPYFTPVYFADRPFEEALTRIGALWGEEFLFHKPFLPFLAANENPAADLTNTGRLPQKAEVASRSNIAAHFLREFSPNLIHFDIFCTTWNWSADYPGAGFGATGSVFNSLYNLFMTP